MTSPQYNELRIFHVDAFTDTLFKGNPAGVCILEDKDISDELKLNIAAELKHSETAFVLFQNGEISIRWFTPVTEVDLCGHATLSAAHVLFEQGRIAANDTIRFRSRSGALTARRVDDTIELDFPRAGLRACEDQPGLKKALGAELLFTGCSDELYFIEIADPVQLRTLEPDINALAAIPPGEFIVTARSDDARFDFISRFFGPAVGIPEDPVTGSAHCYLAPYWSEKLKKTCMTGYQASERGGTVICELSGTDRVKLRGKAVTVFGADLKLQSSNPLSCL